MRLHEYQTKTYLAQSGIPTVQGEVAYTPDEVKHIAETIGGRVALKAQVLVSGRNQQRGILFSDSPDAAYNLAQDLFMRQIYGIPVNKILVEPALEVDNIFYLGISHDRSIARPVLVASYQGGSGIEEAVFSDPTIVFRETIDPFIGLRTYQVLRIASNLDLPRHLYRRLDHIAQGMYQCYVDMDATLLEINPLALTQNDLIALDAKMIVDENALFRHPDLEAVRDTSTDTPSEIAARKANIIYIQLQGQIGCLVNGAGLAMATMDVINLYGSSEIRPANFLDIGGGADVEKIQKAMKIVLSDKNVRAILINIFAGMTRCDEVAAGIIAAHEAQTVDKPLIIRFQGTKAQQGIKLLQSANLPNVTFVTTLTQAAQKSVEAAQRATS
jgi:succinyl-CoA synthetase beta subunit